jgi:glycosyltransferase involved in cell wall biosynthesis
MKRVLHVLRRLDPGGIELWLRDVAQAGGVPGCRLEILLETAEAGKLERDFLTAGVRLHRWRAGDFICLSRQLAGFDAVHAHVHFFSGAILAVAAAARVPIRIAHSHTVAESSQGGRRLYELAMRGLIRKFATHRLGVSAASARSLFGSLDGVEIVPCARQLPALAPQAGEQGVVGHVGRLTPEKNHALLEKLADAAPDLRLLLCGDGPARQRLQAHPRIEFAPEPSDVFRRSSCFVFPSWREGFGLAVAEAQAAGLPCVISNRVPREAWLVPELITALDPAAPVEEWAAAAREQSRRARLPEARERVRNSGFSIERSIAQLAEVYGNA